MRRLFLSILSLILVWGIPTYAQESYPPITLENAESLVPIVAMGRGQPRFVIFSDDGQKLAVGTSVGVWLYNTADLTAPPQQFWMDIAATTLVFSPAGGLIGVGAADGTGRVFDLTTNRQLDYIVAGPVPERGAMANYNVPATGIAFSTIQGTGHKTSGLGAISGTPVTDTDGSTLYLDVIMGGGVPDQTSTTSAAGLTASITDHVVQVGDVTLAGFTQGFAYATMELESIARWVGDELALPTDTTLLMTVGYGGQWLVWNVDTGEIILEQTVEAIPSDLVMTHLDGLEASVVGFDGAITVTDPATGETFSLLDSPDTRRVTALSFNPDGTLLASGRFDSNLTIWDIPSREVITTQYAHFGAVMALDWSPDGEILYSGGEDNRVFAWELTDADEFPLQHSAFLGGHAAPVIGVWALADEGRLVSVSKDGTALVWGIPD